MDLSEKENMRLEEAVSKIVEILPELENSKNDVRAALLDLVTRSKKIESFEVSGLIKGGKLDLHHHMISTRLRHFFNKVFPEGVTLNDVMNLYNDFQKHGNIRYERIRGMVLHGRNHRGHRKEKDFGKKTFVSMFRYLRLFYPDLEPPKAKGFDDVTS